MKDIQYLSFRDVIAIHENTIQIEGGLAGIRDRGLLESAVSMPRQSFGGSELHPTLGSKAAAYLFHIAQNHPFHDGNKRAAVIAAYVFLRANGRTISCPPDELEEVVMSVASSAWSKNQLIEWFEDQVGGQ